MANDFTMKIFCNWFYYKNALQMILLWKYIANDFTIEIYCKYFYYENVLQMIFTIEMYSI